MKPRIPDLRVDLDGTASVWDGACRRCLQCRADVAAWCARWSPAPKDPATWTTIGRTDSSAAVLSAALACLDFVDQAGAWEGAVVVLGGPPGVPDVLRAGGVGCALALGDRPGEPGLAEVRAALADRPTGRADLIVAANGRVDLAAKWVRRGGFVASTVAAAAQPSLDTLVMREVGVLAQRDGAVGLERLRGALTASVRR